MAALSRGEEQPAPRIIALNEDLAVQLGFDPEWLRSPEGLEFLLSHGADGTADESPAHAMAYAGFQFGQYNPTMGDGRALLLGEVTGPTTVQNHGIVGSPRQGHRADPVLALRLRRPRHAALHAARIPLL